MRQEARQAGRRQQPALLQQSEDTAGGCCFWNYRTQLRVLPLVLLLLSTAVLEPDFHLDSNTKERAFWEIIIICSSSVAVLYVERMLTDPNPVHEYINIVCWYKMKERLIFTDICCVKSKTARLHRVQRQLPSLPPCRCSVTAVLKCNSHISADILISTDDDHKIQWLHSVMQTNRQVIQSNVAQTTHDPTEPSVNKNMGICPLCLTAALRCYLLENKWPTKINNQLLNSERDSSAFVFFKIASY